MNLTGPSDQSIKPSLFTPPPKKKTKHKNQTNQRVPRTSMIRVLEYVRVLCYVFVSACLLSAFASLRRKLLQHRQRTSIYQFEIAKERRANARVCLRGPRFTNRISLGAHPEATRP